MDNNNDEVCMNSAPKPKKNKKDKPRQERVTNQNGSQIDAATSGAEVETDTFNPRCVLVTGIGLCSLGHGLKRLLASIVDKSRAIQKDTADPEIKPATEPHAGGEDALPSGKKTQSKAQFIVRFNIHNYVRDGRCHITFPHSSQAAAFLQFYAIDDSPVVVYEGRRLFFSYGASNLRDHFFPSLPFAVRRQMSLDPVATFSVTGEVASLRMATALVEGILPAVVRGFNCGQNRATFVDGTAGVGGNVIGLARAIVNSSQISNAELVSVELDAHRYALLRSNVSAALPMYFGEDARVGAFDSDAHSASQIVSGSITREVGGAALSIEMSLINGCGIANATKRMTNSLFAEGVRILFFDPPWGGPDYAEKGEICLCVDEGGVSANLGFDEIVLRMIGLSKRSHKRAHIVASKLPATYDLTRLAKLVTDASKYESASDRHFPLRFHFDATMVMFVVVSNPYCSSDAGDGKEPLAADPLAGNKFLDSLVDSIMQWHGKGVPADAPLTSASIESDSTCSSRLPWGSQSFEGTGACRPEFYDFEKGRWIQLKKWISTKKRGAAAADL